MNEYGTAIVDVTDPYNLPDSGTFPIIRPGYGNSYDVKTYGRYLYIANEDDGDVLIYDLDDPEDPVPEGYIPVGGQNDPVKAVHNLYIDDEAGILYLVTGSNAGAGNHKIFLYDVAANPASPPFVAVWDFESQYGSWPHDMYVVGNRAYIAHVNAGLLVVDFDAAYNVTAVRQHLYSWIRADCTIDDRVTHSVWVTEEGRYAFTTDELGRFNELDKGALLRVWDLVDIENPPYPLVQFYDVAEDAAGGIIGAGCSDIPPVTVLFNTSVHNVVLHNGYAYVSYYTKGLRILDVRDPTQLVEVGYYDTPAEADAPNPDNWGSWGVYPFLPSGNILVSDDDGLRVFNGPPRAPQGFQVVPVRVGRRFHPKATWTVNTEGDMRHYDVYRNLSGCGPDCGPYTRIATVNHPQNYYIDTQVDYDLSGLNTVYYYAVAVDSGLLESAPSQKGWAPTNVAEKRLEAAGMYVYRLSARSRESDRRFTAARKLVYLK
jgi:hypothetical protein